MSHLYKTSAYYHRQDWEFPIGLGIFPLSRLVFSVQEYTVVDLTPCSPDVVGSKPASQVPSFFCAALYYHLLPI